MKGAVVAAAGLMVLTLALTDAGRVAAQGMKPLLVRVMNTAAEPIPVVPSADLVVLQFPAQSTDACPESTHAVRRVFPDGTFVEAFTVPPGKMLVLTDIQGIVSKRFDWIVGEVATVSAYVGTSPLAVAIRAYAPVNADAASTEVIAVSAHLQSGGVIGPNMPVCVAPGMFFENGARASELQEARLHGYLVAE